MSNGGNPRKMLACYRGDECFGVKTAGEWAEERGVKLSSVLFMTRPAYRRRVREGGTVFYQVGERGC